MRSKQDIGTVLRLIAVAIVAWGTGALYTLIWNPEIVLFREMFWIKKGWAANMAAEHGRKYVVLGGSSTAFGVDAKWLNAERQLPVVNAGLHASLGPKVLTEAAFEMVNDGDTLLVALESDLLTRPLTPTSFAVQFSFGLRHPEWVTHDSFGCKGVPRTSALLALRPGGYHLITALGKQALGMPAYRYSIGEVDDAGFLQPSVRMQVTGVSSYQGRLSSAAREYLAALRKECERRNIRVAYILPWAYCSPERIADFQAENRKLLAEIAEYLPVLRDERLGAYEVREHFADTGLHLIGDGARRRTQELADALRKWDLWTPKDLLHQTTKLSFTDGP